MKFTDDFLCEKIKTTKKPIYIYGMGNGAEKLLQILEALGKKACGIFASDEFVRGQQFCGYTVTKLIDIPKDAFVLQAFGSCEPDVLDRIKSIAKEYEYYVPEMPLFGEARIYDKAFIEKNREKIEKLYSILADDKSREVLLSCVNHAISGKIEYLFEAESEKSEIYNELLSKVQTGYLDCGAYDGDTVLEYIKYKGVPRRIIAVEPHPKNFVKLLKNTENIEGIECLNVGIFDSESTISFTKDAGRHSAKTESGKQIEIKTTTIDKISHPDISYLKLDVEGCEREALLGGIKTLKQKPNLLVACYHKMGDLWDIPLFINEINPEYKLYLRRQKYLPNWECNVIAI